MKDDNKGVTGDLKEFTNEAFLDYSRDDIRKEMEAELSTVRNELGREYPLVIHGRRIQGLKTFTSLNPAVKSEILGTFQLATTSHVEEAIDAASNAFETWKTVTTKERAELLVKTAALMRERKHYFSALLVLEVGKSWAEADGDTAEAIDFCEFYAREALRYASDQPLVRVEGEKNELVYIPLGVGAVIPPWNFPLAIMAGMTAAAIVTGNTVVLKPSSDAPLVAYKFFELLEEAGMPPGVVNFLTGSGAEAGDTMVTHPRTRFVAFTGSMEVGLHINEEAAKPRKGQLWIKRVVAEMGGKDSIIVDADTSVEEAAAAVVSSAFGFQGQKCSACSRAIVDASVYDEFVAKVVEKTNALRIGDPADQATQMGPVINEKAMKKIKEYIDAGAGNGRLVAGGAVHSDHGYFVEPTVIADVAPDARISLEEIFGPVLAIIKSADFEESLTIANNTQFGLTGSVFTNDEAKLERAENEFFVGNLYLNRKCTGALVGVHPFGGFNMSGTDSKAGGRDYLGLFMQAKTISRKIAK